MPDITPLVEENENRKFRLETEKHGTIRFDTLVVWRLQLILEKNNELEKIPSLDFCLNVAKCMLLNFNRITIDQNYYKKLKNLSELTLEINSSELEKFAESFIKNNQESVLDDFPQDQIDTLSNFEIIKRFFLHERERYDKLIKSITGFSNINLSSKIFSGVNAVSKIANLGGNILPSFMNDIIPEMTRLHTSLSKATNPLPGSLFPHPQELVIPEIHDYKIETLVNIEKSFNSFFQSYENTRNYYSELIKLSNECLNQINANIKSQIDNAEKTSREAKRLSIIAIAIAIIALFISTVFGVIQSSLSHKANIQVQALKTFKLL